MRGFISRAGRVGGAVGAAMLLGGCGFSAVGQSGATTGSAGTYTQVVPASALLMVTDGPAAGPALSVLAAATARANEEIRVAAAGTPATTVVAADSPGPVAVGLTAVPTAPGRGATPYQLAQYAKEKKTAQAKRTAEVSAEGAQTWGAGVGLGERAADRGEGEAAGRPARGGRQHGGRERSRGQCADGDGGRSGRCVRASAR